VDHIPQAPLCQCRRERTDTAAEVENLRWRRAEQLIDVSGLVLREVLGRFPAERDAAVEHGLVVRCELIEFRHGSSGQWIHRW